MGGVSLTIQVLGQIVWGFLCLIDSPHNHLLFGLNIILAGMAVASNITLQKEEFIFTAIYLAFWIIPIFILMFASMGGLFESLSLAFQNANTPKVSLLDNPLTMNMKALENYLVSMLIAPSFRLVNWLLKL